MSGLNVAQSKAKIKIPLIVSSLSPSWFSCCVISHGFTGSNGCKIDEVIDKLQDYYDKLDILLLDGACSNR